MGRVTAGNMCFSPGDGITGDASLLDICFFTEDLSKWRVWICQVPLEGQTLSGNFGWAGEALSSDQGSGVHRHVQLLVLRCAGRPKVRQARGDAGKP